MKNKILEKVNNTNLFKISNRFHKSIEISGFQNKTKIKSPKTWIKIYYKTYPRLDRVVLPKPIIPTKNNNLFELILNRRSRRKFSDKNINLEKISTLLYYSGGITQIKNSKWESALRSYPSAGARFPLEIYLIVNNVNGLKRGIYHYNVKEHSLEILNIKNYKKITKDITNQKMAAQANINIVISAVFDRTRIKYGDRGYRFPFIESGHLAQNCYLVSESLGLNCCTIGGFLDNKLNDILDFADSCEKVIYIIAVGQRYENKNNKVE